MGTSETLLELRNNFLVLKTSETAILYYVCETATLYITLYMYMYIYNI